MKLQIFFFSTLFVLAILFWDSQNIYRFYAFSFPFYIFSSLSLFRRCNTLTDIFFALHFEQSIKWSSENGNDVHFLCVWRIEICYYGNSIKTKRSIFQQ